MRAFRTMCEVVAVGAALSCGAVGCAAEGPESLPGEGGEAGPAVTEEVVQGWTLDVSRLQAIPALAAPSARLLPEAIEAGRVQRDLLGEEGLLLRTGQLRTRERFDSSAFSIEVDPVKGTVLAVRKDRASAPAGVVDEGALGRDALERLRGFGIGDDEIEGAVTRELLGQDDARDAKAGAPRLIAYKTFVTRGQHGVRVPGHRAVVTHGPDGALRKVLMKWPALAGSGHRLRVPGGLGAIKERVAEGLAESGRPAGRAELSWVQEASADASGAVRLTLKVAATLPAVDHGEIVEEPEVETIEIGAVE